MTPMDLHVLFIQRREEYPDEHAPEALLVWDEYAVEGDGQAFDLACEKALADAGDDVIASAVIEITVDQDAIRERLVGSLKLKGTIKPEAR
jgi:hypothetical protein